jgi:hypothetical protein
LHRHADTNCNSYTECNAVRDTYTNRHPNEYAESNANTDPSPN